MPKLSNLSPREQQVVEAMATRIASKLVHGPIQWLKAQSLDRLETEYAIEALSRQELEDLFYGETGIEMKATESEE